MPIELSHVGEALVSELVKVLGTRILELCPGFRDARVSGVAKEVRLAPYANAMFDGASRVDMVVFLEDGRGVPFEIKLGETRLSKSRIETEWLAGCRLSHDGKRWAGNMMSILERRFPPDTPHGDLVALVEDRRIPLTPAWFVVARGHVIRSWSNHHRPQYSSNVGLVSFDAMVALLDDDPKEQERKFNELAGRLLQTDYYERWIGASVSE